MKHLCLIILALLLSLSSFAVVGPVLGNASICVGSATTLSDTTAGGIWISGNTYVATVGSGSGIVTGAHVGVTDITYTTGAGSVIQTVTVFPLPAIITGVNRVCPGNTIYITDGTTGGTWSSSNTATATVSSAGAVTGVSSNTVTISYTVAGGCSATFQVTVLPLPAAISGSPALCFGYPQTLTDATSGGTWASSTTSVATIDPAGNVTTVGIGTAVITYTSGIGCIQTQVVTVNRMPAAITGATHVCMGATSVLADTSSGGTWGSSSVTVATIGTGGVVTGITPGTTTISYVLPGGCNVSVIDTVNSLPPIDTITGGGSYCAGGAGVHIGVQPTQIGISYLLHYGVSSTGPIAGTGAPIDFGLLTVAGSYSVSAADIVTGCASRMYGATSVIITPTVTPTSTITSDHGDTVCAGTLVTFSATISTLGGTGYAWYVNGILVSIADSFYSFIPTNGDMIKCVDTTNSPCISDSVATSNTIVMRVVTTPTIPTITISSASVAPVGTFVTVNATVTNAGSSYEIHWYKNGLLFNITTASFALYYKTVGIDTITATVISTSVGCYDSATSNTITVTAYSVNVGNVMNVGNAAISIFPNPATTQLTIQSTDQPINEIIITNMLGQVVYSRQFAVRSVQRDIDVSGFAAGVYFVRVNGAVRKFVKE